MADDRDDLGDDMGAGGDGEGPEIPVIGAGAGEGSGANVSVKPTSVFQCLIDAYCRYGFWGHIRRACEEEKRSKGNPNDSIVNFWLAFAHTCEGQHGEAIRLLNPLVSESAIDQDLRLAATACIINAHKSFKTKDKETLAKLKDQLKVLSSKASNNGLTFAARYFWHSGKEKQARQCLEKVLNKGHKHVEALTLFAWLNLQSGNGRHERKSQQFFDAAIKLCDPNKDINAYLGRAYFYEKIKKRYDKSLDDINQITGMYEDFIPAHLDKARILMIQGNWDEALIIANQIMRRDNTSPDLGGLRISMVYFLTRESRSPKTAERVGHLVSVLQQQEPYNAPLYFHLSQLCSRLAQRNERILEHTLTLIRAASRLDPGNSKYLTEEGYQLMLISRLKQASSLFAEASQLDGNNLAALHGSIKCKILDGDLEYAKQELDFLSDVQSADTGSSHAELTFLHALLAYKQGSGNGNKSIEYLNTAVSEHAKMLETVTPGFDYYIAYNPDFVLELISHYMLHIGSEPLQPGDPPNPQLNHCIHLLQQLTDLVPGMFSAQLLLARTTFIAGDFDSAERALSACLRLEPNGAPAHMIQAQIYLEREQFKQASESLTSARAADLSVRDTPLYHLMKARLLEASDQVDDSLKVLQAAMDQLPGVRKQNYPPSSTHAPVPLQERISIYLELANVHLKLGQVGEATRVMSEARTEFKQTSEAVRISIADADLAVKRGDFDAALTTLKSVPKDSHYATRAKIKMADIYLNHKKNKQMYAACYQDLTYQSNDTNAYVLLGEAYMRIQEPEKAIRAYQGALKLNPDDPQLSSRIGRALITTHDYKRAKEYYQNATRSDANKIYLYHELAELHIALKEYRDAVSVLEQALSETASIRQRDDDLPTLISDVRSYGLLGQVHESSGDREGVRSALTNAFQLQGSVLGLLRSENHDARREQREIMSNICYRLAEFYRTQQHDEEKSAQFYNEALKHNDAHEKARLALAKVHLMNNELDACQSQCLTLLRMDPNNTEVAMMMADILFRQNEPERSTSYFQDLLDKNPQNYEALAKLIHLLRRAGRLGETPRFLKQAEKVNASAVGFHYCKGLHEWFSNNPREALNEFNHARKDGIWGKQATMNMIEIYLNPDNEGLISQQAEAKGDNSEHIHSAEKLLGELAAMGEKSLKYDVLKSYALLARKDKNSVDTALNNFLQIATQDRDYVPALLGSAFAFTLKNEETKAKNQLKRISKMKLNPDYANEFERSWLLLASQYEKINKNDFAQELCKKCLAFNKSCAAAWEMLGAIMEKEQAYKDAAEHYEHAWHFMNESSGSVGYKLAFNYLKAKRFVEAINVCHKVLKNFPDYPKIRKDVLEKARQSLRP